MTVEFVPRRDGTWPVSGRPTWAGRSTRTSDGDARTADLAAPPSAIPTQRTGRPSEPFEPRRPASPEAASLVAQAGHGLAEVARETTAATRFVAAYASALRAGAAILVAKGRPHRRVAKPQSTWTLLAEAAPEVRQWAEYFATHSATHAAAQAGITRRVTAESAEELRRRAADFVALAARVVHGDAASSVFPGGTRPGERRGDR
ncbi:SAV_6107 family HEPN domain-containing protein [Saccharomonospora sp. NB11]|jgi:hypothetical protein|uniref:SAV_6107 family HEPN domain-containing protein n=1 Tax=Saccharomonospora sp. NB11 TaxID=1642298 RepID=UPI0018D1B192|nr:SAV_6107 family HEPN domain-containing protein [Saccharomonospora sp. NB11]